MALVAAINGVCSKWGTFEMTCNPSSAAIRKMYIPKIKVAVLTLIASWVMASSPSRFHRFS